MASPAASPPDFLWRLASRAAIAGIEAYQKHLSPRKGFSCAHRMQHGQSSCSEFVKRAVAQHGLRGAAPLARERFGECKAAARALRMARAQGREIRDEEKKGRKRGGGGFSFLPECDWACCAIEGLGDVADCSLLDGLDCSGCDCTPWN